VLPTGLAPLDALLGGGLPRGRMALLTGARSSGRTALAHAALAAATAGGELAALVDVAGALDARRAEAAGGTLGRLLWVRPPGLRAGLKAADLVLAAGGFGLVVLDVGDGEPGARAALRAEARTIKGQRPTDAAWLRLARAAERSGTALLVSSSSSAMGSGPSPFAELVLRAARAAAPWFQASSSSAAGAAPVLRGLETRVELVRARRGAPGGEAALQLGLR
jgi:hypothetical protein